MKQMEYKRRGFTLLEMIIVIGIIGILSAVFVPAISGYLTRSRLNTANADAKVIFNSMQTICQELEFSERSSDMTTFYGPKIPDAEVTSYATMVGGAELDISSSEISIYVVNGHVLIAKSDMRYDLDHGSGTDYCTITATDGTKKVINGPSASHRWQLFDMLDNPATTTQPMQRMSRLFADNDECSYIVRIQGYQVRGVICATTEDSVYLGGFPKKSEERGGFTPKTPDGAAPFTTNNEWTLREIIKDNDFDFDDALEKYVHNL